MIYKHDQAVQIVHFQHIQRLKQQKQRKHIEAWISNYLKQPKYTVPGKLGNAKRDRRSVIDKIDALSPAFFKLYFRLCREASV